jgi:RecG-like helicase
MEYLSMRMSYGALFQNTLPLPSVCLNHQLKVTWCNQSFIEEFGIQDFRNQLDNLSWDYLKRFINLNDTEPVIESLKSGQEQMAEVRVKKADSSKSEPFQMYIRPVNNNNEKFMLLYFYPLESVEKSIENQSMLVINPTLEALKMLQEERTDQQQWKKIDEYFSSVNASPISLAIQSYRESVEQKLALLLQDVNTFKNENMNLKQQMNTYKMKFTKVEGHLEKGSLAFRQMKTDFLSFAEIVSEQTFDMSDLRTKYDQLAEYAQERDRLLIHSASIIGKVEQSINAISELQKNRASQLNEEYRQDVYISKIKMLLNEIDSQSMLSVGEFKFDGQFNAYKSKIEKFEDSMVSTLQEAFSTMMATRAELKLIDQQYT